MLREEDSTNLAHGCNLVVEHCTDVHRLLGRFVCHGASTSAVVCLRRRQ